MYTHTKFDHSFDFQGTPNLAYFVCSTPRCGSSLLCEALCLTGIAGVPTEYFDQETMAGFLTTWKVDASRYLANLVHRKTTPNGVFGCKAHYHQYLSAFGIEQIPEFGSTVKYVWLSRNDVVRQAISYAKAVQTNQWASTHASLEANPKFNFELIEKYRQQIEYEESQWSQFFDAFEISPLRIFYEDMCDDLMSSLHDVLDWLQVGTASVRRSLPLTLEKQSDEINEQWLQQYRVQKS